jgi:hypothetical protein
MPDLSSFHYVDDIVMVTPKVLRFVFKSAIIRGKKGITTGKPFATGRIICDMCVQVIQRMKLSVENIKCGKDKICNGII